jgi:transcriptional regulator with XRE-family HTH domain
MKFGQLLKIYCNFHNIHTRELAKEIGVSHTTISRIMNGQTADISTVIKLLTWLFGEEKLAAS